MKIIRVNFSIKQITQTHATRTKSTNNNNDQYNSLNHCSQYHKPVNFAYCTFHTTQERKTDQLFSEARRKGIWYVHSSVPPVLYSTVLNQILFQQWATAIFCIRRKVWIVWIRKTLQTLSKNWLALWWNLIIIQIKTEIKKNNMNTNTDSGSSK